MNNVFVLLTVFSLVLVTATVPVSAVDTEPNFDPDDVTIASLNGEDPDQVNEFAVDIDERIHVELAGVDEFERPLQVEIGGDVVSHMEEPDQELRPHSDSDVSTGKQTLQIVWEKRGDRTVVAATEVEVTAVSLEKDDDGGGGLGFDPDNVEIDTIAGQDADQVNEIEVVMNEEIAIELDGVDATEIYAKVELDGTHIGSTTEGNNSFRPREGRDVSEGEQTLSLVRERDGERIVVAETQVDVTRVDLTRDDPTALEFDPEDVTLATVNGDAPTEVELALRYGEEVSFTLDGLDATDHPLWVSLDGTTIGMAGEDESSFRPRTDADVEPGEKRLTITTRSAGEEITVAETTVTVTEVDLDRDADRPGGPAFDPETVSLVAVNGEPADQRNELQVRSDSPLSLQLEGVEVPERGFHVEMGGAVVGVLQEPHGDVRIRRDSNVTTGEQTLQVVWKSEGDRTVLAETPVTVTEVDLDRRQGDESLAEVDLEIVSVNGQPADGVVVTEHDLRGKTPIELTVDGLADTDDEPSIRYKGETVPPGIDGFEISGDRISLDHLPDVEDGEVETLELVQRTGPDAFHVYDSVRIEYRHGADEDDSSTEAAADDSSGEAAGDDDGGILSRITGIFGGGDDTAGDEADDDSSEDDGGLLSRIGELLGL